MRVFLAFLLLSFLPCCGIAQGVQLTQFSKSECQSTPLLKLRPRIISFEQEQETSTLRFLSYTNCCTDLSPQVLQNGQSLYIDLKAEEIEVEEGYVIEVAECDCSCPFSWTISMNNLPLQDYVVFVNKRQIHYSTEPYQTFPIRTIQENEDSKIVTDKYGRWNGKRVQKNSKGTRITEYHHGQETYTFKDKGGKVLIRTTDYAEYLEIIYDDKSRSTASKNSAPKN
jgi:hypothetical protein